MNTNEDRNQHTQTHTNQNMKFRKKPVVIEAERWTRNNLNDDKSMFQDPGVIIKDDGSEFIVGTLEGTVTGKEGDWLIRGVKGELYPCRADIFQLTYDPEEGNTKSEPAITTASVRVMRSYDYCHFEVVLSSSGANTVEAVDQLRKTAARLADKAVKQYAVMQEHVSTNWTRNMELERLYARKAEVEQIPEADRTPEQQAVLTECQNRTFRLRREYDYQEDWQEEAAEAAE